MPGLVCIACARKHPPEATRCGCKGALDHADARPLPTRADLDAPGHGVWRYRHVLGYADKDVVTLGEGDTPLVEDAELGAHVKMEYANPTGSFKDRGACVVVAAARRFGATGVVEDSSGNAGTAVAAYAARAGLPCAIFAPEHITPVKRLQIEALGAGLHVVPGRRERVTDAAVSHAREKGWYYASHAYPPHFLDGCTTIAYELLRQLGRPPDTLVAPCAMGSIVLGAFRGFHGLRQAGIVAHAPRLVAVQASGYDPLARGFGEQSPDPPNRLTDGLLIAEPPRLHQLQDALKSCGGTALSIGEAATRDAMGRLHRRGFLCEPSSAVTLAALDRLRAEGRVERDETVVLVLTGRWKPS